jgi:hypothetical protein
MAPTPYLAMISVPGELCWRLVSKPLEEESWPGVTQRLLATTQSAGVSRLAEWQHWSFSFTPRLCAGYCRHSWNQQEYWQELQTELGSEMSELHRHPCISRQRLAAKNRPGHDDDGCGRWPPRRHGMEIL